MFEKNFYKVYFIRWHKVEPYCFDLIHAELDALLIYDQNEIPEYSPFHLHVITSGFFLNALCWLTFFDKNSQTWF